ncbi:hypothetical protein BK004_04675 [bacterium CG10_46_32]|nr:MAG: hypothetical protein BK004_04675 [bacterium CG10_46_32]PIR55737.1 MAG: hypothetical protein COU73_04715 [Parcubacteria group bacterium CG10_big_fil_rev_8_21_14_0_10_46_32]
MQKQKYTSSISSIKKRHLRIGVFLLIIVLMWVISFKVVGRNRASSGDTIFSSLGADEGRQPSEPVFADAFDYPVIIMIDNHPDAVPYQVGLSRALVVYEVLAEGGSTRFVALFAGAPEGADKIGPIRSVRPYIVEIASGWSAFLWHGGGSPEALTLIPKTDVVDLNEISGLGVRYFWRDNNIPRPHNLFTSGELIKLGIQDFELTSLPQEKLIWQWEDTNTGDAHDLNAPPASTIYIDFSPGIGFDASYEYDAKTDSYTRFLGGVAHRDNASNAHIAPANIIVQKVPAEGYYPSGYDRISLDMEGEGEMLLFQHGRVIAGTWKKETRDSQTQWFLESGEVAVLAQGQTWVEVVPGARSVTYE